MTEQHFSTNLLRSELNKRRESNNTYSVRALARDLGIGKTTVAEVISGKRKLSKSNALKVAQKLNLQEEEAKKLYLS